jgi:hypothetical protein
MVSSSFFTANGSCTIVNLLCLKKYSHHHVDPISENVSQPEGMGGAIGAVIITGTIFKVSTIGQTKMPVQQDPVILGLFQRVVVLLAATVSIESNHSSLFSYLSFIGHILSVLS